MEIENLIEQAKEKNEIGEVEYERLMNEINSLRESDSAVNAIINKNINITFDIYYCNNYKEYLRLNKHMLKTKSLTENEFNIIKAKVKGECDDKVCEHTLFN